MPVALAFLGGPPGSGELILVFLVILLLFGPKRLPVIVRALGRVTDLLRRTSRDFQDNVMSADNGADLKEKSIPAEYTEEVVRDSNAPTETDG